MSTELRKQPRNPVLRPVLRRINETTDVLASKTTQVFAAHIPNRARKGWLLAAALCGLLAAPLGSSAQNLIVLAPLINGSLSGVIADGSGNLFGTTENVGGDGEPEVIFEIPKTSTGYASSATTLAQLSVPYPNTHFVNPIGSLLMDANGNLFGTTYAGSIYELPKTAAGYAPSVNVLTSLNSSTGDYPESNLIFDAAGNLYGTASLDGPGGNGTVFELPLTTSGYGSTVNVLASFNGANGRGLVGGVLMDSAGSLFGTSALTLVNGSLGPGTLYEVPNVNGTYPSSPTVLAYFNGPLGQEPKAGLTADSQGNLFGTTESGGAGGYGTIYEVPKTSTGYGQPVQLVSFNPAGIPYNPIQSTPPSNPGAPLLIDSRGNLFGTTFAGGYGYGTVFEVPKTPTGYATAPIVLGNFSASTGPGPLGGAGLIADGQGNLFGTTMASANGTATAYEITGSGFVPLHEFVGAPGTSNCKGVSTSMLAHTYGSIAAAVKALAYSDVTALQGAISGFCGN